MIVEEVDLISQEAAFRECRKRSRVAGHCERVEHQRDAANGKAGVHMSCYARRATVGNERRRLAKCALDRKITCVARLPDADRGDDGGYYTRNRNRQQAYFEDVAASDT